MKIAKRSHCGKLGLSDRGKEVHLKGWVDALRDHGEVLFIHLRDRSGIVQVVFNPEETPATTCKTSQSLRSEFCISVSGFVKERNEGTENPNIETGTIEVVASDLEILSSSKPLPFPISEKAMVAGATVREIGQVAEDTRLQYRYLDLRRPTMQKNLEMRHQIIKCVRDYLDKLNFVEVETPMLTKSTPEGARDYLVPSRIHPGRFYALPQSPQLFKQLLMVSGIERYFQIVRCFRDEDLRPNRQPEFTQLDLEASFIDEEDIYDLMEELVVRMFTVGDITVSRPFPRMTWTEAMDSMGTDRPDTRFDLRFIDATDIFKDTSYGIFSRIVEKGGFIKGINVKGQSDQLSKNVLQNEYANKIIPSFGGKGMTWMRAVRGTLESNIVQFFSEEEKADIRERFKVRDGDVIIMIADTSYTVVSSVLGQLREHLARRLDLIDKDRVCPVWVTRFPLFTSAGRKITSNHHPFTAPEKSDFDPNGREELLALKSRAYDLVVNGEELGGGSIRIHDSALQQKIFQTLGLSDSEIRKKFGFFLKALEYGAPPHGGIALGLDRVISMILGTETIRDVMAFPKNRSASCPLSGAPSTVGRRQLSDLGLLNLDSGRWVDGKKIMVG